MKSEVKRYIQDWRDNEMICDEDGEYVKFEDYEKLKAQLERAEKILKDFSLERKSEEELIENTELTSEDGSGNQDDCFMYGYLQADACTALRAREYFKENNKGERNE